MHWLSARRLGLGFAASIGVCLSASAQDDSRLLGYPTLTIQYALIWTGHLNGIADGRVGPATRRALESFRSARGLPPGPLSANDAAALVEEGNQVRNGVFRWSTYRSDLGYSLGYPHAYFSRANEEKDGSATFVPTQSGYRLAIVLIRKAVSDADYQAVYQKVRALEGSSDIYAAIKPEFFVVTGRHRSANGDNGYFYTRLERRSDFMVMFGAMVPSDADPRWRRAITAMSSSFSVPDRLATGTFQSEPEKREPDRKLFARTGEGQQELNAEAVYANVSRSVYTVYSSRGADSVIQGSAVAIAPTYLLTNCHVIETQEVILLSSTGEKLPATLYSSDREKDRCALRVHRQLANFVSIRSYASLRVGERVYAIGSPRGLGATLTEGLVSGVRSYKGSRYVQTSAAISQGSSGGGLFDRFGNLVGITTFALRDSQNLNFAISAEDYFQ